MMRINVTKKMDFVIYVIIHSMGILVILLVKVV